MRGLNEIVTLRVLDLIRGLAARRGISESRAVDAVADAMAVRLQSDKHVVRRQLDRYLTGRTREGEREITHRWRLDYLEALADAVGVSLADLVSTTAGSPETPAQTMSQRMFKMLGRTVEEEQAERAVEISRNLLANRKLYDLAVELSAALLRSEVRGAAVAEVARLVSESDAIPVEKPQHSGPAKKAKRRA